MLREQLDKELKGIMKEINKIEEWCNENIKHKRYEEGFKKIQEKLKEAAYIYSEIHD